MPLPKATDPISYVHEKFMLAVHDMATSPKSLRERLIEAYRHFNAVGGEEIPESYREDYAKLRLAVSEKHRSELTDEQVRRFAELITEIDSAVLHQIFDIARK